jgi:hypothetical protein
MRCSLLQAWTRTNSTTIVLITERTRAGLQGARARGHADGRPYSMTPPKIRLAMAAMGKPETTAAIGIALMLSHLLTFLDVPRTPWLLHERNFTMLVQHFPARPFTFAPEP